MDRIKHWMQLSPNQRFKIFLALVAGMITITALGVVNTAMDHNQVKILTHEVNDINHKFISYDSFNLVIDELHKQTEILQQLILAVKEGQDEKIDDNLKKIDVTNKRIDSLLQQFAAMRGKMSDYKPLTK